MEDIVIVSAARTAVGKFGGSLARIPATELGSIAIRAALERAGVTPGQVGEVIMGQVLAAGMGQNPARQALIKSGAFDSTGRSLAPEIDSPNGGTTVVVFKLPGKGGGK